MSHCRGVASSDCHGGLDTGRLRSDGWGNPLKPAETSRRFAPRCFFFGGVVGGVGVFWVLGRKRQKERIHFFCLIIFLDQIYST